MGFFRRLFGRSAVELAQNPPVEPTVYSGILSPDPGVPVATGSVGEVEALWKSQPNLRKVVDFAARNIATIPLRVYERGENDSRIQVRDGDLARLMRSPARNIGPARFWKGVLTDALLYDRWAVLVVPDEEGKPSLVHVPSWRLRLELDDLNVLKSAHYLAVDENGGLQKYQEINLDQAIVWYGYAPNSAGSPMVWTLIDILAEGAESVRYRRQIWENGARTPQWISRPLEAPAWSDEAKKKWGRGFRSAYTGAGSRAGGVPVLEDGMQLHSSESFSPRNVEDLEGRRLSAIEVASAFHIAPELVGAREGSFASVDAYRQMLYRESLGPHIDDWVQAINAQLLPRLSEGRDLYIEPHLDAKLRGSFIEEAQMLTTATGAPWMSVDEARTTQNRPKLGRDYGEPVQPLNLLYGGQMPSLAGEQNRRSKGVELSRQAANEPLKVKASADDEDVAMSTEVLRRFFRRQRESVLAKIGGNEESWWDADRWDRELSDDLYALAVEVAGKIGAATAKELGFPAAAYDEARTLEFLRAVAESRARMVNDTTLDQLRAALDGDLDDEAEKSTPEGVFDEAAGSRSELAGVTLATTLATFAVTEFGRQMPRQGVMKTWVTTSGNPRPSHAAMDGETVPIDDAFSNGLDWPGDISGAGGDAGEIANCSCVVEILIP